MECVTTPTKEFAEQSCSYLIVVVMAVEERLLSEDHTGEHTTQAPHVQAVVIHLQTRKTGNKIPLHFKP